MLKKYLAFIKFSFKYIRRKITKLLHKNSIKISTVLPKIQRKYVEKTYCLNVMKTGILQKYFNLLKKQKNTNEIENVSDILRVNVGRHC